VRKSLAKIRTEISIESNESLVVRRKRHSVRAWCGECRRISIMVLPTEAAFLSGRDIDQIISLMYEREIHVRYIETRGLYLCLTSLCLYPFENEFEETIFDEESTLIKYLTDSKSEKYEFINEE
jgi:hypothetical protein